MMDTVDVYATIWLPYTTNIDPINAGGGYNPDLNPTGIAQQTAILLAHALTQTAVCNCPKN